MKLDLTFHSQLCVPISDITKDIPFFTLSTQSPYGFYATLENETGEICSAYFTQKTPACFSGALCRPKKSGDWVVLWIKSDFALNNSASPFEVCLEGGDTRPQGAYTYMLGIQE
jgi:hypothetical protein